MKQTFFSKWLKAITVGLAVCGLFFYCWAVPSYGRSLAAQMPEFAYCYMPWLVLVLLTAIPCYLVLFFAWKIFNNIGQNRSFVVENAGYLKWISILAAGDVLFFFVMNVVYLFLNMNHPGIVLISLFIVFIGISVSIATAALSYLVLKAAELQEQSDGTI